MVKIGGVFAVMEHNPFNPATRLIVSRTPVDANAKLLTAARCRWTVKDCGFHRFHTRFFLYLPEALYGKASRLEHALAKAPFGGQYAIFSRK